MYMHHIYESMWIYMNIIRAHRDIYAYRRTHIYISTHTHSPTYTYVYMYIYVYIHSHSLLYPTSNDRLVNHQRLVCQPPHVPAIYVLYYMYIYIYMYVYVNIHVYMNMYIHIASQAIALLIINALYVSCATCSRHVHIMYVKIFIYEHIYTSTFIHITYTFRHR